MELAPNGGMDAVARHENIARLRRQSRTIRADEMCGDTCLVLLDRAAAMTRDEILGSDAVAHRIEQHLMQVAAMKREVRPLVARSKAPRLAIDELAVAREEGIVLRCASRSNECVLKAERAQLLDRVRSQIDADAESMQVGSGLEDSDALRCFRAMNRKRQRQSADAPADDDEIH
jgi:hypothetical protein